MSSSINIQRRTLSDATSAADACAQHTISLLDEVLSAQTFATLAISGGSTPKLLFQKMASVKFPWDRVHLFWVDERCVPPTDDDSNYKLAKEYLIQPAHIPDQMLHRIYGELEPKAAAERYVKDIRDFFGLGAGEMPRFDIVHRGIGPDAHTASLFPGDPLINNHEDIAAAVFSESRKQWRVTLLAGPLMAAKHTVFVVAGADKAEAVRGVFQEEYNPMKYPAQIASHPGQGVMWFLDQSAAALLDG